MNELVNAALSYVTLGWRVFPLHGMVNGQCTCGHRGCSSPGKHPIVRRGLHAASSEPRVIKEWWRRWPSSNIAVVTGKSSAIVIIDIDLPSALPSLESLIEHGLEPTLTSLTGGGGIHLFYRSRDADLRNSVGCLPGLEDNLVGVDLRANGGYVVAPPSRHLSGANYQWFDGAVSVEPAPKWLRDRPPKRIEPGPPGENQSSSGLAALERQLEILRRAEVGTRNHTLNRCAFIAGLWISAGQLNEATARSALRQTGVSIGLFPREVVRTVESALSSVTRRH